MILHFDCTGVCMNGCIGEQGVAVETCLGAAHSFLAGFLQLVLIRWKHFVIGANVCTDDDNYCSGQHFQM